MIFSRFWENPEEKKFRLHLKNICGFSPSNLELYYLAFRHKSVAKRIGDTIKDSNERLEFLGDAILDAVIAIYLYNRFPFKAEGELTKFKSKLVSRSNLNHLAIKLGFKEMVNANIDTTKSKSIYGDALEALIGAIYLDKGFNFTEQFIVQRLIELHLDINDLANKTIDFKSEAIEWGQKNRLELRFETIQVGGEKDFYFESKLFVGTQLKGSGTGFNKKIAEQAAAEVFFENLQEEEANEGNPS